MMRRLCLTPARPHAVPDDSAPQRPTTLVLTHTTPHRPLRFGRYALLLLAPPVRREIQRAAIGADDDDDAEQRAHRGAAKLAQSLSFLHGDYHPSTYCSMVKVGVLAVPQLTTTGS